MTLITLHVCALFLSSFLTVVFGVSFFLFFLRNPPQTFVLEPKIFYRMHVDEKCNLNVT